MASENPALGEQNQRQASQQPAEHHSQQRQAGPRSRRMRQAQTLPTDPLQRLQALANKSPQTAQLQRLQEMANNSPQTAQLRRLQAMAQGAEQRAEAEPTTAKPEPAKAKPNLTGLPDHLKSNLEALSGLSMDAVRVHYNSNKPAQLNALAYTQGTEIHLGQGQEQHLPHEAWHVVQQAQGRVRPTLQMAGGVAVNDDAGLEREADVMGGRDLSLLPSQGLRPISHPSQQNSAWPVVQHPNERTDPTSHQSLKPRADQAEGDLRKAESQVSLHNHQRPNDRYFASIASDKMGRTIQKAERHVKSLGPTKDLAAKWNFKRHMLCYLMEYHQTENPREVSAMEGARPYSAIMINAKELAEEIAAELYTWPENWEAEAYPQIFVKTAGKYWIYEYFDGKLKEGYPKQSAFVFKCELTEALNGEKYYQAYHYGGLAV